MLELHGENPLALLARDTWADIGQELRCHLQTRERIRRSLLKRDLDAIEEPSDFCQRRQLR